MGRSKGVVGSPASLKLEEDRACRKIGPLQQKIFHMLNRAERLSQEEHDLLVKFYCTYQTRKSKVRTREVMEIMAIWKEHFNEDEVDW